MICLSVLTFILIGSLVQYHPHPGDYDQVNRMLVVLINLIN